MSLYLISAWMLTLLAAALIGALHGGWLAAVLPLAVMAAWALYVLLGRSRVLSSRAARLGIDTESQHAWVRELVHGLSAPTVAIADGVVTSANAALLDCLGRSHHDDPIVGMPFINLVQTDDRERVASIAVPVADGSESRTASMRLLRADGSVLRCHISALSLAEAPRITLLQLDTSADAHVSHRIESTGLHALVDRLEQSVFQIDSDGRCTFLSQAWERLTGFSTSESVGRPLTSLVHPDDRAEVDAALKRIAAGRAEPLVSEARLVAGDGTLHWIELRASAFVLSTGEPSGAVGSIIEITRRKQHEESLRSSRRHLNALLANVPGMVYRGLNDRDWTMEFVSDGSVELTGYEPREFIDKDKRSFGDLIHPEDREFVWALVQTQLAQSKAYQLSYRITDAVGEIKWVWEQGRGIFSSSGELLALEGFITDVSARRGAEEQAKRRLWFDARTGLASRAIFDDRLTFVLEHASFTGYPFAVFLVDLDDFAALNVRYGHDFGDRLLVQIARRFKVVQGPGTTVSRASGDEFAVLLTDFRLGGAPSAIAAAKDIVPAVSRLAARLNEALAEVVRMEGRECCVTASIGVAIGPSGFASTEAMLQAARQAVVLARATGPGRWRLAEA